MAKKSQQAARNKTTDLEERVALLKEFIKGWKGLQLLTQPLTGRGIGSIPLLSPDQIPAERENQYQELREWLLQTYPRIRADIRKYGGTYTTTRFGPGGLVYRISDYDPIANIFSHAPTLFALGSSYAKPIDFTNDWNAGFDLLNVTLGTLQQALELGGENKLPSQMRPADQVVRMLSAIRRALRKSFKQKPKSEREVQDHLETIFTSLAFKFDREKERFRYSSKSYEPDFTFPEIGAVVEAKLCDTPDREKKIIAEINDDIVAYSTRFAILVFVVYDLGIIRDQSGFTGDIAANPNVIVEIVKH